MATTKLGKICITPQGDYSATTSYHHLDVVQWQGNSYLSLTDNNRGNTPDNESYWQCICHRGASAYEQAVEGGYTKDEATFAQECATMAGVAERTSLLEYPLYSKAAAICKGSFSTNNSALNFTGDRTIELLIKTGDSVNFSTSTILAQFGVSAQGSWINTLYFYGNGLLMYSGYSLITVKPNTQYHIVIVQNTNSSSANVYINNWQQSYTSSSFAFTPNIFTINCNNTFVQHIRLYNRLLSSTEVDSLYNGGRPADYHIPSTGTLRECLTAEFHANGVRDNNWHDSAGCGATLTSNSVPTIDYLAPYYNQVIIQSSAPTSTPNFEGQIFINKTTGNIYMAKGHASSADWVVIG